MHRSNWILITTSVVLFVAGGVAMMNALEGIEWLVDQRYDIPEVTVAEAEVELDAHREDWLVLDVREPDEYAVSHLPGAIRVPPNADAKTFLQTVGDRLADKRVLFYCSVGQRSSKLASRMQDVVGEAGGTGIANLRGGIFCWFGEHGPLVNDDGPVDRIHPYSAVWGTLIPRENPPSPNSDQTEDAP